MTTFLIGILAIVCIWLFQVIKDCIYFYNAVCDETELRRIEELTRQGMKDSLNKMEEDAFGIFKDTGADEANSSSFDGKSLIKKIMEFEDERKALNLLNPLYDAESLTISPKLDLKEIMKTSPDIAGFLGGIQIKFSSVMPEDKALVIGSVCRYCGESMSSFTQCYKNPSPGCYLHEPKMILISFGPEESNGVQDKK